MLRTPDPDVLKRLADLWMLSREREQAKVALQRAARVAPNGRTYEMLGNIFYKDEAWEEAAVRAARDARR